LPPELLPLLDPLLDPELLPLLEPELLPLLDPELLPLPEPELLVGLEGPVEEEHPSVRAKTTIDDAIVPRDRYRFIWDPPAATSVLSSSHTRAVAGTLREEKRARKPGAAHRARVTRV
jgi:hypothetical protein